MIITFFRFLLFDTVFMFDAQIVFTLDVQTVFELEIAHIVRFVFDFGDSFAIVIDDSSFLLEF